MSGGGGAIKGYWYSLGIHMGICRGPVNSIVETRIGDKPMLKFFLEMDHSDTYPIYNPGLFGGTDGEGGIAGPYILMMGEADQVCPPSLALMNYPTPQPGFRRIVSVFFDGLVSAISPYPKQWSFRVRRTTKGWDGAPWYPEKAMIELTRDWTPAEITSTPLIHAMNPAHIFYEVMTNREWGRGLPRAALDDANLRQVADTLFNEGFGLCLFWQRSDSVESFVQSILDHIGAVMRPNLTTGELQLKLLRRDYNVGDLPLFDNESGLLDITEAAVAALPTIINHVLVKFKDPITGKDASVGTHNLAGVQGSDGEINTMTKDYPGLCTPDLAARVALRDLRVSSSALRKFTVTLDRRGQKVQPGDVIRIRDYTRGIPELVMRVGAFEDGPHTDGRIKVTAVQDVFAMSLSSFTGNQPPAWNGPNTSPCIGYNRSFEMPYFMLAHTMNAADLAFVGEDAGYLGQVVELGGRPLNAGYRLAVRNGGATPDDIPDTDTNFCPTVPAEWDGGDCVKVVIVGGSKDFIVSPVRGATESSWVHLYASPDNTLFPATGSIDPNEFSGFILMTPGDGEATAAQTNFAMWGTGDEGYVSATFQKGEDTPFTGPVSWFPAPGTGPGNGLWTWQRLFPLFDCETGETYKVTLTGGGGVRTYEACCSCLVLVSTITVAGAPVAPDLAHGYQAGVSGFGSVVGNGADRLLQFLSNNAGTSSTGAIFDHAQINVYYAGNEDDGFTKMAVSYGGTDYILNATYSPVQQHPDYDGTWHAVVEPNSFFPAIGDTVLLTVESLKLCCGNLPTTGVAKFRISSLTAADTTGFINTSVVDATGSNDPAYKATATVS